MLVFLTKTASYYCFTFLVIRGFRDLYEALIFRSFFSVFGTGGYAERRVYLWRNEKESEQSNKGGELEEEGEGIVWQSGVMNAVVGF